VLDYDPLVNAAEIPYLLFNPSQLRLNALQNAPEKRIYNNSPFICFDQISIITLGFNRSNWQDIMSNIDDCSAFLDFDISYTSCIALLGS
jgi:hypothetical protein